MVLKENNQINITKVTIIFLSSSKKQFDFAPKVYQLKKFKKSNIS